jgi:hypothetical protein
MPVREILMPCIETSYGTAKTSPVLGTDRFYMRLSEGNAFTVEAKPVQLPIPYGGGNAFEGDVVSDQVEVKGNFAFKLYPGIFSSILLNWAITPINSGRTAPWTTTDSGGVMPVGDLASLSFYHAIMQEDGATYTRTRYAGAKCDTWELAAQETGDGRIWTLSGTMTAIRPVGNAWDSSADPDATEFPLPAEANYPTGPYVFGHLGSGTGTVTIASNRAASCKSLRIRGTNKFGPNWYTSRFLTTNRWLGRDVTADVGLRYRVSPNDRTSFRALTALACNFKIDNGTNAVQINFNARNRISDWARETPQDQEYGQTLNLVNRWDPATASDINLTIT